MTVAVKVNGNNVGSFLKSSLDAPFAFLKVHILHLKRNKLNKSDSVVMLEKRYLVITKVHFSNSSRKDGAMMPNIEYLGDVLPTCWPRATPLHEVSDEWEVEDYICSKANDGLMIAIYIFDSRGRNKLAHGKYAMWHFKEQIFLSFLKFGIVHPTVCKIFLPKVKHPRVIKPTLRLVAHWMNGQNDIDS